MPTGFDPTEIGLPTTALVAVSITETVFEPELVTYTRAPFGVIAICSGVSPTEMVVRTAFVAVSTTETLAEPEFVTYATGAASAAFAPTDTRTIR